MFELQDDSGRQRHTSQSYDVTYGGKSMETGALGYDSRLAASYEANFQVTFDVAGDPVQAILPPHVALYRTLIAIAATGGTAPEYDVVISELDGSSPVTVVNGQDPTVVGQTAFDTFFGAVDRDMLVTVTPTADGATGTVTLGLNGMIVIGKWK